MSSAADPFITDPELERHADGRLWSAAWALGLCLVLAGLLIGLGALPLPTAVGLGLVAAPGALGALIAPRRRPVGVLLAVWSQMAALATLLSGGVGGPLSPLLLAPLAASIAYATPAKAGVAASLGALALAVVLQLVGFAKPGPETAANLVAGAALFAAVAGLGGALTLRSKLQKARFASVADDQAFFLGLADALPVTTLALDREGGVEARLGPSAPGLQSAFDRGLLAAASEKDRPALKAALAWALLGGPAEAAFTPAEDPARRLAVSLRRRGDQGLVAMVREIAPEPVATPEPVLAEPPPPPPPSPPPEREAAESGLQQLERLTVRPQTKRIEELEAALVEAQAARADAEQSALARARFLANMSHELRTPLNAILGFSDIMKTRLFGPIPDRYGEYAELIHDSGRHLTDLINDVLDMSKIEADRYELRIERFEVREAVTSALRLVRLQADEAGISLRSSGPREPLVINADRRALKQMVLNLVSNALKFTPKGGEVRVTTEATSDGMLEISVVDTGVGIAPEDLERLGRPFEQAGDAQSRQRGTGLGLSLVKALAGLHGGELSLESALGEGTAATLRLPVIVPPAHSEPESPVDQPAAAPSAPASSPKPEPPPPPMPQARQAPPMPLVRRAPPPPMPPPGLRAAEVIPFNSLRPPPGPQA